MSCELTIDGVVDCGSSSTANVQVATSVRSGEFTIPTFIVYEEDGVTPVLEEDGVTYKREEYVGPVFVLDEDGNIVTDEDDNPVLDESSQLSVYGGSNPIVDGSTSCLWVVIQAKWTNQKPIWVGGALVAPGAGIRLTADKTTPVLSIDDLLNVYIDGYIGDGITYIYGTIAESVDSGLTFGGDQLTFGGDSLTFGS